MTQPKVIAYIASSVNGYIADEKGTEDWVQPESWKRFVKTAKRFGNLIAGAETFKLLGVPELKGVYKVCLSSTMYDIATELGFDTSHIWGTPQTAIDVVRKLGGKNILVAGGSLTLGKFIERDLLDEIWIDLQPSILGGGTQMFPKLESVTGRFNKNLHVLSMKQIGDEVLLKYSIEHDLEQSGT